MPSLMEGWSEARRIAQPFVTSLSHTAPSGAEALRQLQAAGIGYREGDFYEDWRRETGQVLHEAQLRTLRPETQPPTEWMTDKPWDGLTTALVYEFRLEGWDVDKKEWVDKFVGVGTDTRVTHQEAIDSFFQEYIDEKVYGNLVEASMTFTSVWHKSGSEFLQ